MKRNKLLRRLREAFPGEDNEGFGPFDLVHKFGRPQLALLYSELFWPEFRRIEGMTFLASAVEDDADVGRVREALARLNDPQKVERSFNFVEVPSLFGGAKGESTDEEDILLAERLRDMWDARLSSLFPQSEFEVRVIEASDEGEEVGVMFYTKVIPDD